MCESECRSDLLWCHLVSERVAHLPGGGREIAVARCLGGRDEVGVHIHVAQFQFRFVDSPLCCPAPAELCVAGALARYGA